MFTNKMIDLSTEIVAAAATPTEPVSDIESAMTVISKTAKQMKLHADLITEVADWMDRNKEETRKNETVDATMSSIVLLVNGGFEKVVIAAKYIVEISKDGAKNN